MSMSVFFNVTIIICALLSVVCYSDELDKTEFITLKKYLYDVRIPVIMILLDFFVISLCLNNLGYM